VIKKFLKDSFKNKIKKYSAKSKPNPFIKKLLQDNKLLSKYSFIHSLHGYVGKRFFETLAFMIAKEKYREASLQKKLPEKIAEKKIKAVESIMDNLGNKSKKPNKNKEIKLILSKSNKKLKTKKAWLLVDFYMKKKSVEYYFEIKSAKPNSTEVEKSKKKLLECVARRNKKIKTILAIPYNPYDPNPFKNSFIPQYLEQKEIMVGKKF